MKVDDAAALIRDAVGNDAGVWADLGAGTGTFTRALARILDAGSTIYAIDDDARAVVALRAWAATTTARVIYNHRHQDLFDLLLKILVKPVPNL